MIVPNVLLCKTRTYEPQRLEQSVVQQILEHVGFTSNGEIITDFCQEQMVVLYFHDERVYEIHK